MAHGLEELPDNLTRTFAVQVLAASSEGATLALPSHPPSIF